MNMLLELAKHHDTRCRCASCRELFEQGSKQICIAITKQGLRCPIGAEDSGFCHVHDPELLYRQQHPNDFIILTVDDDKIIFDLAILKITISDLAKRLEVNPSILAKRIEALNLVDAFVPGVIELDITAERCIGKTKKGNKCNNIVEGDNSTCCESHAFFAGVTWNNEVPRSSKELKTDRKMRRTVKNQVEKKRNKRKYKNNIGSFIYVFWLGFRGMYKIGYSRNWRQRLKSLQAANPNIKAVLVISGQRRTEKALHKYFNKYKLEREIFQFENENQLINAINHIRLIVGIRVIYLDETIEKVL